MVIYDRKNEQSPQPEKPFLSSEAHSLLADMARLYVLSQPEPGTIYELAAPDLMTFKTKARALWLRPIGPDTEHFNANFEAIKAYIEEHGAEAIIAEERQKEEAGQQARRAAQPEVNKPREPAVEHSTAQEQLNSSRRVGSGVIGELFRR